MFARAQSSIKPDKPAKPAKLDKCARRMANAEKYAGGRGTNEGVLRSEKRNNGRLRTSKVSSNFGDVQDVSASGCRVCCKKKPTINLGESVRIELSSADISLSLPAEVMWIRVMPDCTHNVGLRFTGNEPGRSAQLLELLRNGVANEGLTRGWSPMAGFLEADTLGD